GGAIPDTADYRVVLDPGEVFLGTLNEDFAIESTAGDVFQLGNSSWQILQVGAGVVRVADAHGAPPALPLWRGEAPARSAEVSGGVSDLRRAVGEHIRSADGQAAVRWLESETGIAVSGAEQIVSYLGEAHRMLGEVPTQQVIVLERFFDESGGMQL